MTTERDLGLKMSEDDLLQGILDIMGYRQWLAYHVRRSDRAITMGSTGFPDIIAVPPAGKGPALAIECKADKGYVKPAQAFWLTSLRHAGVTCAVVRPKDYKRATDLIADCDSTLESWSWAEHL